jgi:hypothetical protein
LIVKLKINGTLFALLILILAGVAAAEMIKPNFSFSGIEKMHKLISLVALLGGMVLSAPSWAIVIDGTEVGVYDNLVAKTTLSNNGQATETNWVSSQISGEAVFLGKFDDNFDWLSTGDDYAHLLPTTPLYFLVKLGMGGLSGDTHLLFDNQADLEYAVFNLSTLAQGNSTSSPGKHMNIGRVSHISMFNSAASVPEPGLIGLLGLGLIAIGAQRRRRSI